VAGKEVAQLYIGFPTEANEPEKQLRGFQKVELQPGASATVRFEVQRRDLSVWDTEKQNWKLFSGKFKAFVSQSSRKDALTGTFEISAV
jgi:beta-glucosidase